MARKAYGRVFLHCIGCDFIFCHDYPEFAALQGMGMTGSWGGESSGGEREDFLARLTHARFGANRILLYGVGSALAFPVLVAEGFDVYGTDVSKDVVEFRRRQAGDRFFHAMDLSSRAELFDTIIACEVFEHFHNPTRWIADIMGKLASDGILCGTTNLYPGGPIEDGQKVGYMSFTGHVAYWSKKSLSKALGNYNMSLIEFEMVCPGSIKRDKKFNDLFPNKRVFFASRNDEKLKMLADMRRECNVLPLDLSAYPHPAYNS